MGSWKLSKNLPKLNTFDKSLVLVKMEQKIQYSLVTSWRTSRGPKHGYHLRGALRLGMVTTCVSCHKLLTLGWVPNTSPAQNSSCLHYSIFCSFWLGGAGPISWSRRVPQHIYWTQKNLDPNFFFTQNFFLTQTFFNPIFFWTQNFSDSKFFQI